MTLGEAMRWWDLDEVIAIEGAVFGRGAWTMEQFYGELAAVGRWLRLVRSDDGRIAGYVDVAVSGRDADLMTVAVAPWARGRGIGTEMLGAALVHARTHAATTMFLEVRADNPARRLYEGVGFEAIDQRRGYYPDGADAVVMRARL